MSSWSAIGASALGTAHRRFDIGCQDSYGWFTSSAGALCAVVADGAGSRDRSAEGSALAVQTALELVRDATQASKPVPDCLTLLEAGRSKIEELAKRTGVGVGSFATTVSVVVASAGSIRVAQVGDCIVVLRRGDEYLLVSPEEKGEYDNETVFLTSDDWRDDLRVDDFDAEAIDAIVLSSDGLKRKILELSKPPAPYIPFFADVLEYAGRDGRSSAGVARFIGGLDDQTGDDKTLVIARRVASSDDHEQFVLNEIVHIEPPNSNGDRPVNEADDDQPVENAQD